MGPKDHPETLHYSNSHKIHVQNSICSVKEKEAKSVQSVHVCVFATLVSIECVPA